MKLKIQNIRNEMTLATISGNFKNFKKASKEYAKLAVDNYELLKNIKAPKVTVPLFSKEGMNILKVMFLDWFRIKTPEEKKLKQLAKEDSLKQKFNLQG